ncbi:NADP-dependent phosphogluconate dehydrogenase [Pararhizobium haloflavum]|uniref:NADP-dependent phosphogluconate dehydrogenase n=1 Tax=Pararhizobium haloflavum TaxID=2037914 RepID=UPI000C185038|nr:NADP-dependent phosphogluconate dehydrogenase [Pararhizobium haloflavum]
MSDAEIGLIGLGVMGRNLALNIAENAAKIAVFNRTSARTDEFFETAGDLQERIVACESLEDLVAAIRPPRPIIIMVQAGEAVDAQIEALRPLLGDKDIIIDAGNANFHDTRRRSDALDGSGLTFIGMGVSGGEEGARHGPSMMVGGTPQSYDRIKSTVEAIAARYEGEPCVAHLGSDGAGHFVKTIHNGIEYADMQMIAEIYGIMRDGLNMDAATIGDVFERWNGGRLNSYLIEITGKVLKADDGKTGRPIVDVIKDSAGQKGTGRWSAIESQMLGVPATTIEAAVAARALSALRGERMAAEEAFGLPSALPISDADRDRFIDQLEAALMAGKIAAYAQGFAVMSAASDEYGWTLPMPTIARIWRAGCIIRSQFLDEIASAFDDNPDAANLMVTPKFADLMRQSDRNLRAVVSIATTAGLPVPALGSALAYFDGYRRGRGTANLVQAQRDFFGAHGFERLGEDGAHHGPWSSAAND